MIQRCLYGRSHAIFSITLKCEYMDAKEGPVSLQGRLNLVDLSGSENIKRSGAEGMRAREAGTIGQSLLAFSRVITGLVHGGSLCVSCNVSSSAGTRSSLTC
jgi:kinesin family protein 11